MQIICVSGKLFTIKSTTLKNCHKINKKLQTGLRWDYYEIASDTMKKNRRIRTLLGWWLVLTLWRWLPTYSTSSHSPLLHTYNHTRIFCTTNSENMNMHEMSIYELHAVCLYSYRNQLSTKLKCKRFARASNYIMQITTFLSNSSGR